MVLILFAKQNRDDKSWIAHLLKNSNMVGCATRSVLGPLLFSLYDKLMIFAAAQIKSNFYLFADDGNLLYADKNLKSLDK